MTFDPSPLVDAAREVLTKLGPLDATTLVGHLDAALFGDEWRAEEYPEVLDGYLMDSDRVAELPDGRLANADALTWGLTLTHRLTERELASEGVDIEPDLGSLLGFDRDGFELGGGGWVNAAYAHDLEGEEGNEDVPVNGALFGPPGWLSSYRAGDLVAFRRRGGSLDVSAADPDGERTQEAVEALRAAFQAWRESSTIVFTVSCVFAVLDASPELLRSPSLPLSELAGEAGLETQADRLVDPVDQRERMSQMLADRYGFEDCCAEAFMACSGFMLILRDRDDFPPRVCRGYADLLAHGGVSSAFCDFHLGSRAVVDTQDVERFLNTLGRHARQSGHAAVRYVQSVLADLRGDAVEAERSCVTALSEDPGFAPALFALAGFAEDRGDAARAISYRSRLDPADERIERLRVFAEPPHRAGRNEPCPCGSGRKYKVCCARSVGASLQERAPWLYERATMWALGPTRLDLVRALARERAGVDEPGARDELPDLTVVELALFEEGLLARYLDARAAVMRSDELDLGRRWVGTPRTVWEVASVRTGEGLELADMTTGDRVVVGDRASSRTLHAGDWLWARVVHDGEASMFVGGPTIVPLRARESLLALIDSRPDAFEMAAWLSDAEQMRMTTFEGQAVVLCEARYRVPDAAAAGARLAERLEAKADGSFVDKVEIRGDEIVRGFIRLEDDVATVTTNAEERFARLRELLLEAAPGAVLESEERTDAAEAVRRARHGASPQPEPSLDELPPETRAELTRALDDQMTRWEERWVDEPIPALQGATPRQALDDPTRRGDLMTLLREMEERAPVAGLGRAMDPERLRKLLGLRE